MSYFDHPYWSNSKLTQLGNELGIFRNFFGENYPTENYRLGTLFDAVATEPHLIDKLNQTIAGTSYTFSMDELYANTKMRDKLHSNATYKSILALKPNFQLEIYNDEFSFKGMPAIGFKAKLDLHLPNMVIDLKTTACTSKKQFEDACLMFGYYRQMAIYMELTNSKSALLFGISKKAPYNVFVVKFDENHEHYNDATETVKLLIYKALMLY